MDDNELEGKITDVASSVSDAKQKVYNLYSQLYDEGKPCNTYLQIAQDLENIEDLLYAKANELEND